MPADFRILFGRLAIKKARWQDWVSPPSTNGLIAYRFCGMKPFSLPHFFAGCIDSCARQEPAGEEIDAWATGKPRRIYLEGPAPSDNLLGPLAKASVTACGVTATNAPRFHFSRGALGFSLYSPSFAPIYLSLVRERVKCQRGSGLSGAGGASLNWKKQLRFFTNGGGPPRVMVAMTTLYLRRLQS